MGTLKQQRTDRYTAIW